MSVHAPVHALVTGAAGFIGSHLCETLAERSGNVVGVDNFDAFYDRATKEANVARVGDRLRLEEADIRDRDAMRSIVGDAKPDVIYHWAALAGVRPSIADPARYAAVNLDGLVSVLDAARETGCRRVVFASSSSVYGNNDKVPFAETDPVNEPISPYAATKRAGELLCHAYTHLFGLSIGCMRLFTVYGPAQRPDLAIAKFMRLIADGKPVPRFGDGSMSRDYTYIDDIVAGALAADAKLEAEGDGYFRIWNLGGSKPTTLTDMIEAIGRVMGREPAIEALPPQPGDVERTWADLSRVGDELGWAPTVPFEEGLARQWGAICTT